MSAPMNPVAPAAKPRPTSVTISSYLLFLVAALQVIGLVMALSVMGAFREAYEKAFAGTEMAEAATTIAVATFIGMAVFGLLLAAGLVVLAILNNKGKNPARIVTWVIGGIWLCCGGIGLLGQAAGSAFGAGAPGDANGPDPAEMERILEERLPDWFTPVSTLTSVISLIALLVALILLALPASNEFFRKPQATWEPPVPGGTYPGYPMTPPAGPAQPPYPGYPTTPPTGSHEPPPPPPTPPTS
ncbi:MAG TPA: hypothetical protein VFX61_19950 [Micromonosporaceae bacterium]|nr:hypothetical protein [Micromonosporaceae bacterium]